MKWRYSIAALCLLGCASGAPAPARPTSVQCPERAESCPAGCTGFAPYAVRLAGACHLGRTIWGCHPEEAVFAGVERCSVDEASGLAYVSGVGRAYPGARDCTAEEEEVAQSALGTRCPE